MSYVLLLLAFVPAAIVLRYAGASADIVFVLSCLGIVPLANMLGEATEEVAARILGGRS